MKKCQYPSTGNFQHKLYKQWNSIWSNTINDVHLPYWHGKTFIIQWVEKKLWWGMIVWLPHIKLGVFVCIPVGTHVWEICRNH